MTSPAHHAEDGHAIHALGALIDEHREVARSAGAGRSSVTLSGGRAHPLRQTLIVLVAGSELAEHDAPGEATLQVLDGAVQLRTAVAAWDLRRGDLMRIPPQRHSLAALEDSAVLLTVVVGRHDPNA